MNPRSPKVVDALVDLGAMALMLGRINRTACYHPDGEMRESDTDHTVMLGLIAPALAQGLYGDGLRVGRVAELALVHDLAEVYAGDTPTLRELSADGKADKMAREAAAVRRIQLRFDAVLPWLGVRLAEYEDLSSNEARFVKAVDKMLPKIVHILDGAKGLREEGMGLEEFRKRMARQGDEIFRYASGYPELEAIRQQLVRTAAEELE